MKRKLHLNGTRHCCACDRWKILGDFHRNKRNWDGLHAHCKECMAKSAARRYELKRDFLLEQGKKYRAENQKKRKDGQLRDRFDIDIEQYERRLAEQGGGCAICGGTGKRSLHVDHCHETGRIRGLLCFRCNSALGAFRDSETVLMAAIEYLRKSKAEGARDAISVRV